MTGELLSLDGGEWAHDLVTWQHQAREGEGPAVIGGHRFHKIENVDATTPRVVQHELERIFAPLEGRVEVVSVDEIVAEGDTIALVYTWRDQIAQSAPQPGPGRVK